MAHTTETPAAPTPNNSVSGALLQADIEEIRELLPFNWRQQIAAKTGLTPRQVGEAFHLRTTNKKFNRLTWNSIIPILESCNKLELARKCQARIAATNIHQ